MSDHIVVSSDGRASLATAESSLLDFLDEPTNQVDGPEQSHDDLAAWLAQETNCSIDAARQAVEYVAAEDAAVGTVPTQQQVVFERFFDESGGMQLVVHAPFGGRINRAWGLAMRKRFCRSFDFELQATADDDGFILSLGPQHSFPIESLFSMLRPDNCRALLEQAIIAVPMFHLRWRWNVTRRLAGRPSAQRQKGGSRAAAISQRRPADGCLPQADGLSGRAYGRPCYSRSSPRASNDARLSARGT